MAKFPQVIALCIALSARMACAQTMSVEDRKAVLDAQTDLVRKEMELTKALKESAGASATGMPAVVSVSIVGGQRSVLLQLSNGAQDHFREGEEVQQGLRINSIGLKKVVASMEQGKKTAFISLASAIPQTTGNQNDPNRTNQAVPNEMLPPPPVVTVPTVKSILPLPSQINAAQAAPLAKQVK